MTDNARSNTTWTLVLAGLAAFMTALDTLVVTTALPVLRVDLHASLSDLEWTVNGYNLAFATFLLTGAALGDRFGRRRMFCVGLGVFTAASAASALAPSVEALIAARVFQGAGAAIVTPLTLTLITEAFPSEKRGAAIGLWGGITGLAVAIGPVVGGAVVSGIDWHWIFWLNVPIGLALIPVAAKRLTESFGPATTLDLRGLALAGGGVLGLTWGLVRANDLGWTSTEVLAALIAGGALVAAFIAWEHRAQNPMIPSALLRSPSFGAANAVSFFMYAALFGVLFLMSQLFQTALGYSSIETGLRLLPWTLTPMFIAPVAGALADRYGKPPVHGPGPGSPGGRVRVDRGDRVDQPRLPRVRCRVHRDRGRDVVVLPDRRHRDHGQRAAAPRRRRVGRQLGAARAGRGGRRIGAGGRVRRSGRLRLGARVRRRLQARDLGRGRAVGRGRRRGADDRCAPPERCAVGRGGWSRGVTPARGGAVTFAECSLELRGSIRYLAGMLFDLDDDTRLLQRDGPRVRHAGGRAGGRGARPDEVVPVRARGEDGRARLDGDPVPRGGRRRRGIDARSTRSPSRS